MKLILKDCDTGSVDTSILTRWKEKTKTFSKVCKYPGCDKCREANVEKFVRVIKRTGAKEIHWEKHFSRLTFQVPEESKVLEYPSTEDALDALKVLYPEGCEISFGEDYATAYPKSIEYGDDW